MASIWIASRTTSKGVERWDVRFEGPPLRRDDGTTRRRLHLGSFATKKQAEKRKEWAENEWAAGRAPDPRRILANQMPATGDRMELVAADWLASRRSIAPLTRVTYKHWADEVVRVFPGYPVRVSPDDVRNWISDMERADLKPGTIRLAVSILSMILEHATVEPNPVRHRSVELPAGTGARIRLPSGGELTKIRSAMKREDYKRLLDFLEDTGSRISEACALKWDAVQADRILIPGAKGKGGVVKPRWIDEDLHTIRLLREERRSGSVFNASVKGFTAALYAACDHAGVRRYSPHDCRHLHLSRLVHRGASIAAVAERAGHSNPTTTLRIYAHVVPRD